MRVIFDPRDSDKDLADDIGFGLWRHGRLKIPIETCRMIGAGTVTLIGKLQAK